MDKQMGLMLLIGDVLLSLLRQVLLIAGLVVVVCV